MRYIAATLLALSLIISTTTHAEGLLTISQKPRPFFDPLHIHTGAWEFKPNLLINTEYNDNIFATQNNTQADIKTTATPQITVNSNWNRHRIEANVSAEINKYADFNAENYTNVNANIKGRYDILNATYLTALFAHKVQHQNRKSRDDIKGITPTKYSTTQAEIAFTRALRRISLELSANLKSYDFAATQTTTGALDNSARNRNEYALTSKVSYEYLPDYNLFISSTLDKRHYNSNTQRDSSGFNLLTGLEIDISSKIDATLYAGYQLRSYDFAQSKNTDGIKLGGDLLWNVNNLTSILSGLDISIEETSLANSSGYINTSGFIRTEHELLTNLYLIAGTSYNNQDYLGTASTQFNDHIYGGNLAAHYLWNKNLNLSLNYNYETRKSNTSNSNYNENRIFSTISLSY